MQFLNSSWIAQALGLSSPENKKFTKISTDTREIQGGELFVALKGENSDGHDFIPKAVASGAAGVVHRAGISLPAGTLSFPADDTLLAYRKLAGAWRREFSMPLAAIGGSAGKTTSKEFLAAILTGKYPSVLKTLASQNGFQGIPTTLLRLRPEHRVAVIEVGIDEPGSMRQHLDLVQPNFGLLSSIGPEHLEKLIDLDTVEREEGILFHSLQENGGLAAVNNDDERIRNQADKIKGLRKISYGISARAEIHGSHDHHSRSLLVEGISQTPEDFSCPLEGTHNALNLLGAIALAHAMGLNAGEIRRGLASFTPPPGRSEVHDWNGVKVYADTYNANPASVTAALKTIPKGSGRVIICLGDMLELGKLEEFYHRSLAQPILDAHADFVYLFGPRMKSLENELQKIRFHGRFSHFANKDALAGEIKKEARSGDVLLLKGSRGMAMEKIWEILRA